MRTSKTVSISLPPAQLRKAEQLARKESRTMSELIREALRRYEEGSASTSAARPCVLFLDELDKAMRRAPLRRAPPGPRSPSPSRPSRRMPPGKAWIA
ncbi:MAG: ribbon-helix-helix protein, CopG family [Terriglobales bacterium]